MIENRGMSNFYMWFNNETKYAYFLTPHYMIGDVVKFNNTYGMKAKIEFERNNLSIADYKCKNIEVMKTPYLRACPYCERIGRMLMYFLNTDFTKFASAYDNFYHIYGNELIYMYTNLEPLKDFYKTEKELYKALEKLHKSVVDKLIEIQNNFKVAIDNIYNLNSKEFRENYQEYFLADIIKDKNNLKQYVDDIEIGKYTYVEEQQMYQHYTFEELVKELTEDVSIAKITNFYTSQNIGSICFVILQEIVKNNMLIRRCQHCNKYYVPTKSNEIYCDYINESGKNCKEQGALTTHRENVKNDKGLLEYRRIYNKKCNVISRNKTDKVIRKEFDEWKKEAKMKVKEYKQKLISEEELYKWMCESDW